MSLKVQEGIPSALAGPGSEPIGRDLAGLLP